ncbi:MAG: spore coat protein [Tissierellia bacterium]|nr:spore coat protein [Tissierellia bacterium]
MQERDIVNDLLAGTKASINAYTMAIQECSNQQLRSTFQTLRNEAEQLQYQLYQMAEQKGYYTPAPQAHQNDVSQIKTSLQSAVNTTNQMR